MVSNINPTHPVTGNPTTASVRANFAAAKTEIEAIQASIDALPATRYASFPGVTSSVVGQARWYPGAACTLKALTLWSASPPPSDTVVDLRVNGIVAGSCTLGNGAAQPASVVLTVPVGTTDYVTLDLTSTGAVEVGVRIDF